MAKPLWSLHLDPWVYGDITHLLPNPFLLLLRLLLSSFFFLLPSSSSCCSLLNSCGFRTINNVFLFLFLLLLILLHDRHNTRQEGGGRGFYLLLTNLYKCIMLLGKLINIRNTRSCCSVLFCASVDLSTMLSVKKSPRSLPITMHLKHGLFYTALSVTQRKTRENTVRPKLSQYNY